MSEWQLRSLEDFVSINPRESLAKGTLAKKIGMEYLQPFVKQVSGYQIEEYKGGTKFRNGDTLVARITPCLENGKTAYVNILDTDEVAFGSTEYIVLRELQNVSDKQFIYYFSRSEYFRDIAIALMTGSSGRQRVQTDSLSKYLFEFPPLPEQKAIADVLSALDDKIDLLQRQNETLEKMAETLFRQWFIEEVKEDWEELPLSAIATFTNGLACQKFPPKKGEIGLPVLKIKELTAGITESSDRATSDVKSECIINHGDVIFAWSASLMVKIWSGETCVLNQHLFNVQSEDFPKWFYYEWCKYYLREFVAIANSHATTMGHIKRKDLDEAMVSIPSELELLEMNKIMIPNLNRIILNLKQIQTLQNLRDTLLPKLMSGEVRVKLD